MKQAPHDQRIIWQRTNHSEFPYETKVDGVRWQIRVNDFPAEALYTLLIAGQEREDYDEWPSRWRRPD